MFAVHCQKFCARIRQEHVSFISGCLELVARVGVVYLIPLIVNGNGMTFDVPGIGSFTSNHYGWAYISVCLAHPAAWLLAVIPCGIAIYYYVFKIS